MASSGLQHVNLFMTLFPFVLSTGIVGVRIWRRTVERKFAIDDALVALAQFLLLGLTIATCIFIKKSYTGYHLEDIPKGAINPSETGMWRYVNAVIYNPILALIKLSFLLTLIKLEHPSRSIRICLWILFAINVAFLFAGTLIAMLSCVPIPKFWDRKIPGYCVDKKKYVYSTIAVTIITDILVTIMPAWILYGLHMRRKQKAVIIMFMSLGLVVAAIASYRLAFFVRLFRLNDPLHQESPYNVRTPLSNIEANLAAIAACGPTLKWMLGRFIPFFDTSGRSNTSSKGYTRNGSGKSGALGYPKRRDKSKSSKLEDQIDVTINDLEDEQPGSNGDSDVELRDRIGWKGMRHRAEADAQSDEQRMVTRGESEGIIRTVEWEVKQGKDPTPTMPRCIY